MGKRSIISKETSRREFTKLAAGLVALPITSLQANSQNKGAKKPGPKNPKQNPSKVPCGPQYVLRTHEPPILVWGGSMNIDLKDRLSTNDNTPPFRYMKDGLMYREIANVRVVTEHAGNEGEISDITYYPRQVSQLWLWYQRIRPTPSNPECDCEYLPDLTADPQVRIKGDPFELFIDERLHARAATHKPARPNRYAHPGQGWGRHFRIGRWRLVRPNGSQIFGDAGADGYTFYIAFED